MLFSQNFFLCNTNIYTCIKIYFRDHFFDTSVRNSKKHRRKNGRIKLPFESAHGEQGVRQYHARDDSKILAHKRLGLMDLPER
jgi:hypothetical protein